MESPKQALNCPLACGACRQAGDKLEYGTAAERCAARRLVLALHNPAPRARVFGFKEIYSPWIRRPDAISEVLDAVGFMRRLFPKAKVIFHWRENLTRIASSDFWRLERRRDESASHFGRVIETYRSYMKMHPDHAFGTTLEDITGYRDLAKQRAWCDRHRLLKLPSNETMYRCLQPSLENLEHTFGHNGENVTWQMLFYLKCCAPELRPPWTAALPWCRRTRDARNAAALRPGLICRNPGESVSKLDQLLQFLQEDISNESVRMAAEVELVPLHDWSEELHTRRVPVRLPNGTVVFEAKRYAWATSYQSLQ